MIKISSDFKFNAPSWFPGKCPRKTPFKAQCPTPPGWDNVLSKTGGLKPPQGSPPPLATALTCMYMLSLLKEIFLNIPFFIYFHLSIHEIINKKSFRVVWSIKLFWILKMLSWFMVLCNSKLPKINTELLSRL